MIAVLRKYIVSCSCFWAVVMNAAATDPAVVVVGDAYSQSGNLLIYTETHRIEPLQHTVSYRSADGTLIAENSLDYSNDRFAPAFQQRNLEENSTRGGRWTEQGYELFRDDRASVIDASPPLVASSGFNEFIKANLERLQTERSIEFNFALPDRLDTVRLKATMDREADSDLRLIKIRAANVFLAAFVPDINLYYDQRGRLARYEGPSNVKIEGADVMVSIQYRYEGDTDTAQSESRHAGNYSS